MSMPVDEILQNPAFQTLEPARVAALRGVMLRLQGKSAAEALPVITEFMRTAPKGHELSRAEQSAMAEAILSGLSPQEQPRFRAIMKLLGMG